MELDIIIITYNCGDLAANCISSLKNAAPDLQFNVIIVDNNSSDDTIPFLKSKYPNLTYIINNSNLGYAKAVNIGAKASNSEFLIISNADVIYHKDSISKLYSFIKNNNDCAVASPQQIYPNGKWQYSYGDFPGFSRAMKELLLISQLTRLFKSKTFKIGKSNLPFKVEYGDGAVMFVRRSDFNSVSGFDEDYFFFSEEMDFCYKLRKINKFVYFVPNSIVTHVRGGTDTVNTNAIKRMKMLAYSKALFCKKNLTKKESLFYFRSQFCLNSFLLAITNIFMFFGLKRFSLRKEIYNEDKNIWKEIIKENINA